MPIEWSGELELGIPEIDEQHMELFRVYEDFSQNIEQGMRRETFDTFLALLDRYARDHFRYEELLLTRSGYRDAERHIEKHGDFTTYLATVRQRLKTEGPSKELAFEAKRKLLRWLVKHIGKRDRSFCTYLLRNAATAQKDMEGKKLGEILVEADLISPTTLERALQRQQEMKEKLGTILQQMGVAGAEEIAKALAIQGGECHASKKIGTILVNLGLISYATLESAIARQRTSGKKLGAALIEMGVVTPEEIIVAQAIQKGMIKPA